MLIGPQLERALKSKLPGLRTIPVQYAASLATNMSAQRTDAASIAKGNAAFSQASSCRVIVAGGYSQGAAVMHNVVSKLDGSLKSKVAGVALFGDTRNKQDGGHIPNFPSQKSRVWCNKNDGVCGGGLNVNAGHLSYSGTQINEAASWLAGLAKGGSGGSAEAPSAPAAPAPKAAKGPAKAASGGAAKAASGGEAKGHSHGRI